MTGTKVRMPRGSTVAAVAVIALVAPLLVLPGSAASTATADDPDDVSTPLDIRTVTASSSSSTLTFTDTLYGAVPDAGTAEIVWAVDADNDGTVDVEIGAALDGGTWSAAVHDPTLTTEVAPATVSRPGPDAIAVSFPRAAIGSPAAYTFTSASRYDLDGDGAFQDDEIDEAPDLGWVEVGKPVYRVAGPDRLATAIAASRSGFDDGQAGAVVLARDDGFPDALTGTPLAIAEGGPLLLTPASSLHADVAYEIERVLPAGGTVYLLGGTAALAPTVADSVSALGYPVTRFAGTDRYDTALQVAEQGLGNPSTILLTTGLTFPDALSAGAAAGALGGAVLLTAGPVMPDAVAAYIEAHTPSERYAVGGPAAQADPRATPIAGSDRYITSRMVADTFFPEPAGAAITSGTRFPDALSAGAHTAGTAPLVLTDPADLTLAVRDYLAAHTASLEVVAVFGGAGAAVSDAVRGTAELALNMPVPSALRVVDGTLVKDDQPYRGIGVNYFDAFYRNVKDPDDTSFDAGFAELAAAGVPFARVMAGGYWPSEHRLYLDDPDEFFGRFDGVVQSAERHGIGLVLTFFWHRATVPDLVGESVSAWGDPTSRTHAHMRRFVGDVVGRYVGSPAVWGWEFGDEYSYFASLPNAEEHRPPVVPELGTPEVRTVEDDLTVEAVRTAYVAFAREVRRYDAMRFISSGNSSVRNNAWHNWVEGTWTTDTPEQTAEMMRGDNPNPMDVVSIHSYGSNIAAGMPDAGGVHTAVDISHSTRKPLFLGAFGVPDGSGTTADLAAVLQTVEQSGVDLAALWVYDRADQPEWSVTATNERSWQLDAIAAANARLQQGG